LSVNTLLGFETSLHSCSSVEFPCLGDSIGSGSKGLTCREERVSRTDGDVIVLPSGLYAKTSPLQNLTEGGTPVPEDSLPLMVFETKTMVLHYWRNR